MQTSQVKLGTICCLTLTLSCPQQKLKAPYPLGEGVAGDYQSTWVGGVGEGGSRSHRENKKH